MGITAVASVCASVMECDERGQLDLSIPQRSDLFQTDSDSNGCPLLLAHSLCLTGFKNQGKTSIKKDCGKSVSPNIGLI